MYRHHVEPRVKLYSPRKESFPIPLKYIEFCKEYISTTEKWLRWLRKLYLQHEQHPHEQ